MHTNPQGTCRHCGRTVQRNVQGKHERACWENPELKRRLLAVVPRDIRPGDWKVFSSAQKVPSYPMVRQRFGTFAAFLDWLFAGVDDEVLAQIAADHAVNRAALRGELRGLAVFEQPRREFATTDGRTMQVWGVR